MLLQKNCETGLLVPVRAGLHGAAGVLLTHSDSNRFYRDDPQFKPDGRRNVETFRERGGFGLVPGH